MAEQRTVNASVAGSNPAVGAKVLGRQPFVAEWYTQSMAMLPKGVEVRVLSKRLIPPKTIKRIYSVDSLDA